MVRTETAAPEPAGRTVRHVPVRAIGSVGVLRFSRLCDGGCRAVRSGSAEARAALLGPDQASVALTRSAPRRAAAPVTVPVVQLQPQQ
ncbi:hypothetical protein [Streptomyces sp. CB03911]|uniref:hypothetical protein n=1 Tax=Streptomyces sp. CB03911 TaxID=1804758 RepID=UPI000938E001|nr:hypothetical protein [Streptomyces sp. CB03911]OKI26841.1 hypothetical protein A6A07_28970 [Streptomyces sp. CB03911]